VRILTLWEPWASLMAYGVKETETRSWRTSYRGRVAIHAAQYSKEIGRTAELFAGGGKGWIGDKLAKRPRKDWALGYVIAVGDLFAIHPTSQALVTPRERLLGDYTAGRYAWHFRDVVRIDPRKWKGAQGLRRLPFGFAEELIYLHQKELAERSPFR